MNRLPRRHNDKNLHAAEKFIFAGFVLIFILIIASHLVGCASFTTDQVDERINEETGEKTTVRTRVTARTFFDAKSELAKFKANQTSATQSAAVGSLGQESSGSNAVNAIEAVARGAVQGALKPH